MKIVIDTNIVFSALLNPNSSISKIILDSLNKFDFYSPKFILEELVKHQSKILEISGYSVRDLKILQAVLFKKITLVEMEFIRESTFKKAYELTKGVDEDDTPFVALAMELESILWTGDKKLLNGLSKKGIDWVLTTDMISRI
ncbi:MAG: putative toxin-antitoxin system toxin component, PIN family [Bacteroidota bacterium]